MALLNPQKGYGEGGVQRRTYILGMQTLSRAREESVFSALSKSGFGNSVNLNQAGLQQPIMLVLKVRKNTAGKFDSHIHYVVKDWLNRSLLQPIWKSCCSFRSHTWDASFGHLHAWRVSVKLSKARPNIIIIILRKVQGIFLHSSWTKTVKNLLPNGGCYWNFDREIGTGPCFESMSFRSALDEFIRHSEGQNTAVKNVFMRGDCLTGSVPHWVWLEIQPFWCPRHLLVRVFHTGWIRSEDYAPHPV